jgi:hypothetical protein
MPLNVATTKRHLFLTLRGATDIKAISMGTGRTLVSYQLMGKKIAINQIYDACSEIEKYLTNGITQASTLVPLYEKHAEVTNPTLFEDSDLYSLHYAAVPFEVQKVTDLNFDLRQFRGTIILFHLQNKIGTCPKVHFHT